MKQLKKIAGMIITPLWQILHISFAGVGFAVHYLELRYIKATLRGKNPGRKFIIVDLIEHMGDIVACEPVSRHVKEKYPDSYLVWAVRRPYRELIDTNPHIDKTLVVFCLTEWIFLSKTSLFDKMIDLHVQGRICPRCKIRLNKKTGNIAITVENYYEFGNALTAFTQSAGLNIPDSGPHVYIPIQAEERINSFKLPSSFITVHCTSNEVSRDWTADKWIALLNKIFDRTDYYVVEVGSKTALLNYRHPRWITLCGKTSALETAEVIKRSTVFIGVDSAPAHLANAVNTYGIILIGYYRAFKKHLPYSGNYAAGSGATILYEDGPAANIKVDSVYQEIVKYLELRSDVYSN